MHEYIISFDNYVQYFFKSAGKKTPLIMALFVIYGGLMFFPSISLAQCEEEIEVEKMYAVATSNAVYRQTNYEIYKSDICALGFCTFVEGVSQHEESEIASPLNAGGIQADGTVEFTYNWTDCEGQSRLISYPANINNWRGGSGWNLCLEKDIADTWVNLGEPAGGCSREFISKSMSLSLSLAVISADSLGKAINAAKEAINGYRRLKELSLTCDKPSLYDTQQHISAFPNFIYIYELPLEETEQPTQLSCVKDSRDPAGGGPDGSPPPPGDDPPCRGIPCHPQYPPPPPWDDDCDTQPTISEKK